MELTSKLIKYNISHKDVSNNNYGVDGLIQYNFKDPFSIEEWTYLENHIIKTSKERIVEELKGRVSFESLVSYEMKSLTVLHSD